MRRSLSLSVAILFLATAFAGCLGGEVDFTPSPVDAAEAHESGETGNATVDDGTEEMSVEAGHMPHLHDYWKGKERVTVMDADIEVDQFDAIGFTFFNTFRGTPGVGGAFFRLPEGSLVYEGTGSMEIHASWTDPTVTGAGIQYRSPASESFSQVHPLQPTSPLVLDITPEMTDMPHDKESRWIFLLVPSQAGQVIVGKVHLRIDVVRVRDIMTFPGHPELFEGKNTLTLYDGAATSSTQNFATMIVGFATDNQQESGVRSEKVVPMETMSMTANVTITSTTSNVGSVSNVTFLYKPAGAFRMERAQVLSADVEAGIFQFAWPVEMQQTDSPYADESQWTFDLRIQTDPAGQGWETNGLADAQVEYQLQVVAYDSLLESIRPAMEDDDDR